jgi:biofilm PGA synthesis N-glycosyltransferase PgaC
VIEWLALAAGSVTAYLGDCLDWLARLGPYDFLRIFWGFVLIEFPRYFLSNLAVLLWATRDEARAPAQVWPEPPLVTVVVAALNEAGTIRRTARSLLEQSWPRLEIVIVDDGSTDGTAEALAAFDRRSELRLLCLATRQGKSASVNAGLEIARGDYVVLMDADSTLERDAVTELMAPMRDPAVAAVGGNLVVANYDRSPLTAVQALEYLLSLSMGRRFKSALGILSIVPGAFGVYRRELLDRVGGLEPGPGCDSDATLRMRKLRKRIAFAPAARCHTRTPERLGHLVRQRLRWDRNLVRNRVRRHRDLIDPRQDHFSASNLFAALEPLVFLGVLPVLWVVYLLDVLVNFEGELGFVLVTIFCVHLLANSLRAVMALVVNDFGYQRRVILPAIPLYVACYRPLLKLLRVVALAQEIFFRSSYRDPFAPEQVRREAQIF